MESNRAESDTEGRAAKVTQSIWRSREVLCRSWTLKEETVILKLSWRHQDFEILELCHTCSGKQLSGNKTTPKKRNSTLSKPERCCKSEEHFDNRYEDSEFGDCLAGFFLI